MVYRHTCETKTREQALYQSSNRRPTELYGLAIAIAGVIAELPIGWLDRGGVWSLIAQGGIVASLLCPLGLIICAVSFLRYRSRLAVWGIFIGLFGSIHIPTIFLVFW